MFLKTVLERKIANSVWPLPGHSLPFSRQLHENTQHKSVRRIKTISRDVQNTVHAESAGLWRVYIYT